MTKHQQITNLFVKSNSTLSKKWPEPKSNASADWIVYQSGIPWLQLDVDIPVETIFNEITQAEHLLVNHRDQYGEHLGWRSFCLHGKSLTQTGHCEDSRPYQWIPEVERLMPNTVNFFKNWGIGSYQRVRVMAVDPQGYVSLHRDLNSGQENNFLGPINIAITQPDDCHFVLKDWGEIPFQSGDAFMPDVNNWHAVVNNSNQTRYHIIVHSNDWSESFKQLIQTSYMSMFDKFSV